MEESVSERLLSGLGAQELLQNEIIARARLSQRGAAGMLRADLRASLAGRQDPGAGPQVPAPLGLGVLQPFLPCAFSLPQFPLLFVQLFSFGIALMRTSLCCRVRCDRNM